MRYRLLGGDDDWSPPLERTGSEPLALIDFAAVARREIWPGPQHYGLPVLLPPGEEGRLLRLEHSDDGMTWRWALEFSGKHGPG